MSLKILHLEDTVMKQMAITRVIHKAVPAEIDWVTDMAAGVEKIEAAIRAGQPYDLAITDMHYPMSKGLKADWGTGDFFVELVANKYENLPVILCSSQNMKHPKAYGCIWYSDISDWEKELTEYILSLSSL